MTEDEACGVVLRAYEAEFFGVRYDRNRVRGDDLREKVIGLLQGQADKHLDAAVAYAEELLDPGLAHSRRWVAESDADEERRCAAIALGAAKLQR